MYGFYCIVLIKYHFLNCFKLKLRRKTLCAKIKWLGTSVFVDYNFDLTISFHHDGRSNAPGSWRSFA